MECRVTTMWLVPFVISVFSVGGIFCSTYQYCTDLQPQPHVSIEQLMGMWYGIEIYSHSTNVRDFDNYTVACPVIYFFEDNTPTTLSPLHANYNYDSNYGSGYGSYSSNRQQEQYYSQRPPNYRTHQRNSMHKEQLKFKQLRLWWFEYDNGVEYKLKYNETRPGFWISSGPHNGSSLEPQYDYFAGTVQVLKAVGSHLVLTFCYQMPDKQMFSVVLSREHKLTNSDLHGLHNLFTRKGIETYKIKKVCVSSSNKNVVLNVFVLISLTFSLLFSVQVSFS